MPEQDTSNPLLTIPVVAASSVAILICNAVFISSKDETIGLAASAFAVTGLIAILPWQLASAMDAVKHSETRERLVKSGCVMSLASILFISATLLRYFHFHAEELITMQEDKMKTAKTGAEIIATLSFMAASLMMGYGILKFVNLKSEILNK